MLLLAQGDPAGARAEVERLIKASGAETVAVAAYDTQTGRSLLVNERASLHAASTMKVPVMMEIFRLAEEGKLSLGESVEVRNRFRSIVDGSEYSLSREDDSDDEVYLRVGRGMTDPRAHRSHDHPEQQPRDQHSHRAGGRRAGDRAHAPARRGRHSGAPRRRGH